jgi:hypothetical protein
VHYCTAYGPEAPPHLCRYKLSPLGLSGESYIAKLAEAMFQVQITKLVYPACI